jgi:L-asparaginase II
MIAGEGRFDTEAMTLFGERLSVKAGGEGLHCAAPPELGLAVKADDGAARAARIARFLPMSEAERGHFAEHVAPRIADWSGLEVGALRPTAALG